MQGLLEAFNGAVERHGDKVAIVESDGTEVSFAELSGRVELYALCWSKRGLKPGDRVLLAMPIGADLYAALAAIWSCGATAVLPEPAMGLTGVRYAVRLASCQGLVASGPYPWLRWLLPALWGKPLYRPGAATGGHAPRSPELDEIALISFTSGTTGVPKAIPRSHGFLQAQRKAVAPLLDSETDEVDLVAFPVFVLINLAAGRTSVLPNWKMNKLDLVTPEALADWIARRRVTRALLPPKLCDTLGRAAIPASLGTVFTGGGPVFPDMIERMQAAKPDLRIVSVYGSTEAEPIAELDVARVTDADRQAMMAGQGLLAGPPVAGLDLRIADGEIQVAGNHVNPGYLDPSRDAETKVVDRGTLWHRTGDAGRIDNQGRLWLLGRHGDDVAGHFPFAVETAARTWSGVTAAALVDLGGRAVLVLQGDRSALAGWRDRATQLGIEDVRHLANIPVDQRHRSKVDRKALAKLLK